MAPRFDRDRFAYELAQELGVDYARVPAARLPDEAVAEIQQGLQGTMEVGPQEEEREPDGGTDVTYGAAAGLSTLNRARPTPLASSGRADDEGEL